jgi:hypothetical protein
MAYTPFYTGGWKDYTNTTTPITAAALNHIEEGIAAAAQGGATFIAKQGGPRTENYYIEIYKHDVAGTASLSTEYQLTNPYYYYTMEGWMRMQTLDANAFGMHSDTISVNAFDGVDGTAFFNAVTNPSGRWTWIPEICLLGTCPGASASSFRNFEPISYLNPRFLLSRPWATLSPQSSGTFAGTIELDATVISIPVTDDTLKFTNADMDTLSVYFRIKIDQVRKESVG